MIMSRLPFVADLCWPCIALLYSLRKLPMQSAIVSPVRCRAALQVKLKQKQGRRKVG